MKQSLVHIALLVRDYDEAIEFYTKKLHFTVVEDTYQPEQEKRWVLVAPPGSSETTLLLAKASQPENPNKNRVLEIKQAVESFFFSQPMIFGETTMK